MRSASLATARSEGRLSLVRDPVPAPMEPAAAPAWRRTAGAALVALTLGATLLTAIAVSAAW